MNKPLQKLASLALTEFFLAATCGLGVSLVVNGCHDVDAGKQTAAAALDRFIDICPDKTPGTITCTTENLEHAKEVHTDALVRQDVGRAEMGAGGGIMFGSGLGFLALGAALYRRRRH